MCYTNLLDKIKTQRVFPSTLQVDYDNKMEYIYKL